jgi:hypothetical protein
MHATRPSLVNRNFYRCLFVKERGVRPRGAIAIIVRKLDVRPPRRIHVFYTVSRGRQEGEAIFFAASDAAVKILVEEENGLLLIGNLESVEVADGDEAEKAIIAIHDGKVTNAAIFHGTAGFLETRIGSAAGDLDGHDVANRGDSGIASLGDDALQDVALAEHARDALAVADDEGADAMLGHELGCM